MARRVGLRESRSLTGQTVNVGSFMEAGAVAPHVAPAEVVNQEENDVRQTLHPMDFILRTANRY